MQKIGLTGKCRQGLPFFGQPEWPGPANEQIQSKPFFQLGNALADSRLRYAKGPSGFGNTSRFLDDPKSPDHCERKILRI